MSKKSSGIWSITLPLAVVVLAAAYYIKMPKVRDAVDARAPWVADLLGRFVQEPEIKLVVVKQEKPAPPPPEVREKPKAPIVPAAPVAVMKVPEKPTPPAPPQSAAVDLQKIANDRSTWPKKVILTKPSSFPAVLNGKVVGSLVAPAGAEATVVSIKEGKVALEFNGGGAWLPIDQTDLLARVQPGR